MLYHRNGFPEEDELVLCTINKVFPHSVFCTIDEFRKTGVIHISEVSPGRIRNIRDFVREDKKIVCKVLRVNKEKGHIDLSLRRVNDSQKRSKTNQIKQEVMAERILEFICKKFNKDPLKVYNSIAPKVFDDYDSLYDLFEDIVEGNNSFDSFDFDKDFVKELLVMIKQRIKPAEVIIKGVLELSSSSTDGIEIIKGALVKALSIGDGVNIKYKSAGNYSVSVKSFDYPSAEKILKSVIDLITKAVGNHASLSFDRDK
jgi:translation initiation factor 2 subunit 1